MLSSSRSLLFALPALGLLALLAVPGCSSEDDPWGQTDKLRVVTSFPPLYCFAANVAGEDAAVRCLLDTQGPHGYQYDPREIKLLRKADVFFGNGLTLDDHFTHKLKNSCGNGDLRFVELAACIDKSRLIKSKGHACAVCKDGEVHHHHHGEMDPHVWLGIPEAIDMVNCIAKELAARDPAHAKNYRDRAGSYVDSLRKLQEDGQQKLAGKGVKIITVHESLGYFARAFDVEVVDFIQKMPGDEPSPAELRDLAKLCVDNGIRIIAVEPQYPQNTAQALLRVLKEKGVPDPVLVSIDPLETVPEGLEGKGGGPEWYGRRMAENIDNLAKALK